MPRSDRYEASRWVATSAHGRAEKSAFGHAGLNVRFTNCFDRFPIILRKAEVALRDLRP